MAGTATCSGEGGMIPDERRYSSKWFYQCIQSRYGFNPHHLPLADACEFFMGQGCKVGLGGHLMGNLNQIKDDFPDKIKEVRGKGLLTAFEMHDEKHLDGHTVSVELLNHGVYAKETHHSTVRLAPALTINNEQVDRLCDSIHSVIKGL